MCFHLAVMTEHSAGGTHVLSCCSDSPPEFANKSKNQCIRLDFEGRRKPHCGWLNVNTRKQKAALTENAPIHTVETQQINPHLRGAGGAICLQSWASSVCPCVLGPTSELSQASTLIFSIRVNSNLGHRESSSVEQKSRKHRWNRAHRQSCGRSSCVGLLVHADEWVTAPVGETHGSAM